MLLKNCKLILKKQNFWLTKTRLSSFAKHFIRSDGNLICCATFIVTMDYAGTLPFGLATLMFGDTK